MNFESFKAGTETWRVSKARKAPNTSRRPGIHEYMLSINNMLYFCTKWIPYTPRDLNGNPRFFPFPAKNVTAGWRELQGISWLLFKLQGAMTYQTTLEFHDKSKFKQYMMIWIRIKLKKNGRNDPSSLLQGREGWGSASFFSPINAEVPKAHQWHTYTWKYSQVFSRWPLCISSIGNNSKSHLKSVPLYGKKSTVTYQYYGING